MAETPIFQDQVCYGLDLRQVNIAQIKKSKKLQLKWLIEPLSKIARES